MTTTQVARWCAIAALLVLQACSTQTIQQGAAFAKSGVDYCDTVQGFLDVYLVTRIDVNSKRALDDRAERIGAQEVATLPALLDEYDSRVVTAVRETTTLRGNVMLLRAYFQNLDALTTSTLPDEGGAALKELGSAITSVNAATGGSAAAFTPEQLGYVEKIGKIAVKAAVAAKVRAALERDKQTIAYQLVLQQRMLEALARPIQDEYKREIVAFRKKNVASPYANGAANLGGDWIDDRRRWAQSQFHVEAFDKAGRAAAKMQSVWEAMLSDHTDIQSIRLLLADLKDFTGVVHAFDEAEKKK